MERYLLPGEKRRLRPGSLRLLAASLLAAFAAGAALWVWLLPALAAGALAGAAGTRATVGSGTFNPFTGRLLLEEVRIANPAGFPSGDALWIRRVEARVRPLSLFSRQARFSHLAIDLGACTVALDPRERFNWAVLGAELRKALRTGNLPLSLAPLGLVRSRDFSAERVEFRLERLRVVDGTRTPPRSANLAPRVSETARSLPDWRSAAETFGVATLSEVAREALETDQRETVRILSGVARELGTRVRDRDAAVSNLMRQVWPTEPEAADSAP